MMSKVRRRGPPGPFGNTGAGHFAGGDGAARGVGGRRRDGEPLSCMEDSHVNSKCQSHLPPNALERARGVALSLRCHLQSLTSLPWASGCCPGAFQKRPLSPSSSLTPHPTLPEPRATASPNGLCGEAAAGASVPPACLPGLLPWPEHFRGSLGLCRMKTHTLDLGGDSWDAQEGDSRDGHPGWARRPARPWACSSAPPPGT